MPDWTANRAMAVAQLPQLEPSSTVGSEFPSPSMIRKNTSAPCDCD
ncbi:hypothetical protein J2S90_004218 [Arthrobacter bambusae]|uniref:Uncharacterized protein n=1 Tax=Arthrobacter bambusae TaxID=1338426 RepID=A0AAW8DL35_9MICC|nr:hypothetical protein [Arthrobacter bambusae]MDQ0131286.1 hypothetical protein [Arthrobacter bambusae]MDQ0182619.1 hypothetical protein [Arthrobacter bambusae]